jgi:hypothetical protein
LFGIIIKTGRKIWSKHSKREAFQETQIMMFMFLTAFSTVAFSYLFANTLHYRAITGNLWIFSGAIFALERQLMRDTQRELMIDD